MSGSTDLHVLQNIFIEVLTCLSGDGSFKNYACEGKTQVQGNFSPIPKGAVKKSVIQVGADQGKNLFEAARERLAE